MEGDTSQSTAVDAADVQDPAILGAINGPPAVGPGTFYSQPNGNGGFVAPDVATPDNTLFSGGFFSSVPWWAWAALAGIVVLKVVR
jgi:hypothetical protein